MNTSSASGATPGGRREQIKTVRILGTHGVPANYGGFETAAENVALYLVSKGWRVVVYCQENGSGAIREDTWRGIERVIIPVNLESWRGTSLFDWRCISHAVRFKDLCLTFGYNTGIFFFRLRLKGIKNIVNMDGMEWTRARWGIVEKTILYVNEKFAALFGNHLIADHPVIETYLRTLASERRISTITYGAHAPGTTSPDPVVMRNIVPHNYLTLIARPVPENSILELVRAFSSKPRGCKLVVLGNYDGRKDPYHREVLSCASNEVLFVGGIYDLEAVAALRLYSLGYLHGHTVGGTNPSLVEAMAAANAIIAHDNPYNRWVAQDGALYFSNEAEIDRHISALLTDTQLRISLGNASRERYRTEFTWDRVAGQYEELLRRYW